MSGVRVLYRKLSSCLQGIPWRRNYCDSKGVHTLNEEVQTPQAVEKLQPQNLPTFGSREPTVRSEMNHPLLLKNVNRFFPMQNARMMPYTLQTVMSRSVREELESKKQTSKELQPTNLQPFGEEIPLENREASRIFLSKHFKNQCPPKPRVYDNRYYLSCAKPRKHMERVTEIDQIRRMNRHFSEWRKYETESFEAKPMNTKAIYKIPLNNPAVIKIKHQREYSTNANRCSSTLTKLQQVTSWIKARNQQKMEELQIESPTILACNVLEHKGDKSEKLKHFIDKAVHDIYRKQELANWLSSQDNLDLIKPKTSENEGSHSTEENKEIVFGKMEEVDDNANINTNYLDEILKDKVEIDESKKKDISNLDPLNVLKCNLSPINFRQFRTTNLSGLPITDVRQHKPEVTTHKYYTGSSCVPLTKYKRKIHITFSPGFSLNI